MEPLDSFYRFGVALLIGLLVGLQREYAHEREELQETEGKHELFAGVRTFALLGVLGCAAGLVAEVVGTRLAFVALLFITGALITVAYYVNASRGQIGMTTEVAALMTVIAGTLCYFGLLGIAAGLGVAMAVLLALKVQAQALVRNLTREDVYAALTLAVITVIVLPLLPREGYGPPPLNVLVPFQIWLMVVFISGISFLGYILIKLVGPQRGVGLTGVLGGLASSTAVTLTFSQRSRDVDSFSSPLALAILLAWTMMFARVIVEVAVLNRPLLGIVWRPLAAAMGVSLAYCTYLYFRSHRQWQGEQARFTNPFELQAAVTFGLLYALILLGANAARLYLSDTGIYLSSIVSGLVDVDAITLSMAELSQGEEALDLGTAGRAIVLASASNTVVKGGIALVLGSSELRRVILPGLLFTLATAIALGFML